MRILALTLVILLSGCATAIDGSRYWESEPEFSLSDFFSGPVKGWGIVQNRSGNVIQRFTVDIVPRGDSKALILDETFHYEYGSGVRQRTWRITSDGQFRLQGVAGDVVDVASGTIHGSALQWEYQMEVPTANGKTYVISFNDWMWQFADGKTLVNRSYLKKFGFPVGEVTLFMQRQSSVKSSPAG